MKKEIKEKLIKERLDWMKTRINEMITKLNGSTSLRIDIDEKTNWEDGKTKIYNLYVRSETLNRTHEFKSAKREKEIIEMLGMLNGIENVLEFLIAEKNALHTHS